MLSQVGGGINGVRVEGANAISGQHGVAEALAHLVTLIVQEDASLLAFDLRQVAAVLLEFPSATWSRMTRRPRSSIVLGRKNAGSHTRQIEDAPVSSKFLHPGGGRPLGV